jgi:hypothetical protein
MSRRRREHNTARRLARRAYRRQGGLCFWCKRPMLLADRAGSTSGGAPPRLMTAEHVRPVWDGEPTVAGNVVAACYECNHGRSGELNRAKRGFKFTIGDDTPSSPFAGLRVLLQLDRD